jgi:hypothetical protein
MAGRKEINREVAGMVAEARQQQGTSGKVIRTKGVQGEFLWFMYSFGR